ncbi:methyl-accepting chemotaxis protein [Prosthecobacter dejongeii]|uniref:Tetratricopeptide (TPR) repeat protein n=1 Tax=Prosthecobacter dejongeii TaxID=48465 RepID=A0A7W7YKB6_9BACT|nr:methyl-accepting chemotaxis protein [Prosthecobacter dejongeii]MBB5037783.1 tetratricopeptide (TPR) repeat protein [Prosthecobacter dejongeii]
MSTPSSIRYEIENKTKELRQIDLEYHMQLAASNSGEIADSMRHLIKSQAAQASEMLRVNQNQLSTSIKMVEMMEMENDALGDIAAGLDTLSYHFSEANETLGEISEKLSEIGQTLTQMGQLMWENHQQLRLIVDALQRPYETKLKELRREGEKWLRQGARRGGEDRIEDWKDAMRLFELVVENPIGKQDFTAWFHLGFLKWKLQSNYVEAEAAFGRAQRLSAVDADVSNTRQVEWHIISLRHQALMQQEQNKNEVALATIQKALQIKKNDAWLTFEAARYAAGCGLASDAGQFLEQALDLEPLVYVQMLADPQLCSL